MTDFSIASTHERIGKLSENGLDIHVQEAVSLVKRLREGTIGAPSKDGSCMSFEELCALHRRRWPPALKAAQVVADATLHQKIRANEAGLAISEIVAELIRLEQSAFVCAV